MSRDHRYLCHGLGGVFIETEHETDGRWIAEIPELPGTMTYGDTREKAIANAEALAVRVLAERIENGEPLCLT